MALQRLTFSPFEEKWSSFSALDFTFLLKAIGAKGPKIAVPSGSAPFSSLNHAFMCFIKANFTYNQTENLL